MFWFHASNKSSYRIKDPLMEKLILRGKTKNKRSELEYEEEEEGDKIRLPITLDNRENPGVTL